jgi:hydrogenase nickel incorporation protein HypA/HybF
MHELSIANTLVELVEQQLSSHSDSKVRSVRLLIGALSCVHREALEFSFELVTEGTLLQGAHLEIESVPVTVYCPVCDSVEPLEGIQSFRCPRCQTPTADIRSGRELELHSIEVDSLLV